MPRMEMPSFAINSVRVCKIKDLYRSMPSARDCTTSTSENLSTTRPGRKSASPKITRQLPVSTTFFRYSQAFSTRVLRKASSIS